MPLFVLYDPTALRGQNWVGVRTVNPETYPAHEPTPPVDFVSMEVALDPLDTGNQAIAAARMPGDAYPRWVLLVDPGDAIFYMGDGTFDPIYGAAAQLGGGADGVFVNRLNCGGSALINGELDTGGVISIGTYAALPPLAAPPPAPTDPIAAHLFARDNAGKKQLCVRFPTGAVQILATEP